MKRATQQFVIDRTAVVPTCFPVDLNLDDLTDVSVIGAQWATFINLDTGVIHRCAYYYKRLCILSGGVS